MTTTHHLTGQLTAPDYALPAWAQDHLTLALWDRDAGPEQPLVSGPASGPHGAFDLPLSDAAAQQMALGGLREGPQQVVSVGWGADRDPGLVELPWRADGRLGWDGCVTLLGYVEQLHLLEWDELPLAVLEVVGHVAPFTYRRLPPLPLPATGDRHSLHTDRHLHDTPEHACYLLADADSPLAALAQDALVSSLQVVALASLGEQAAGWHELVSLPLVLDSLTLIGP